MRRYVFVRFNDVVAQRHSSATEDVHFAEALVEAVLEDLTEPGDRVLDPFAGFGTVLTVAERLGRVAVGVELMPERAAVMRSDAPLSQVVEGDSRQLGTLVEGPFDLVLTSPPYMTATEHPEDPLTAYEVLGGSYSGYLEQIADVMRQAVEMLTPSGHLVLNVANLLHGGRLSPLAWDIGRAVADVADLVQDVSVCWDVSLDGLAGDYLLVFRPAPGRRPITDAPG